MYDQVDSIELIDGGVISDECVVKWEQGSSLVQVVSQRECEKWMEERNMENPGIRILERLLERTRGRSSTQLPGTTRLSGHNPAQADPLPGNIRSSGYGSIRAVQKLKLGVCFDPSKE